MLLDQMKQNNLIKEKSNELTEIEKKINQDFIKKTPPSNTQIQPLGIINSQRLLPQDNIINKFLNKQIENVISNYNSLSTPLKSMDKAYELDSKNSNEQPNNLNDIQKNSSNGSFNQKDFNFPINPIHEPKNLIRETNQNIEFPTYNIITNHIERSKLIPIRDFRRFKKSMNSIY